MWIINHIKLLWELQEIENKMKIIKAQLHNLESLNEVEEARKCVNQAEGSIKTKEDKNTSNKKKLRSLEMKDKEIIDEIKEINQKLYGGKVNNTKELTQMEKKIQILSQERNKIEDLIIQQMELIESTEELIKQEKININEKEQEANYLDERVKKESRKLKKEYKTLKDVRDELIKEIPEESLRKYNQLRKSLGNFVLSKVKNGICLGCQVSLSSSLVGKLYTPGIEVTCENCGRLIFMDKD